jgi:hypothetical protein
VLVIVLVIGSVFGLVKSDSDRVSYRVSEKC